MSNSESDTSVIVRADRTRPDAERTLSNEDTRNIDYLPPPSRYKPGIFGAMLQAQATAVNVATRAPRLSSIKDETTMNNRSRASGSSTSTDFGSQSTLRHASGPVTPTSNTSHTRPPIKQYPSWRVVSNAVSSTRTRANRKKKKTLIEDADVVEEIADIIARRRYLVQLGDALMQYGAPTHRVEDWLVASSRALLIDADFVYILSIMIITFADYATATNTVEVIRRKEAVDFYRLRDTFEVYKNVIYEKTTAEQGLKQLTTIHHRQNPHKLWFVIFNYGIASVSICFSAFDGTPIDAGPAFLLGCSLGIVQETVVTKSQQFANVFEVAMSTLTAFLARALGSIRKPNSTHHVFCFSALAQASIALILPGYFVLQAALELQSRNIISGAVRLVYAIVYTLFLAFGQLLGTALFGLMKRDAVDNLVCSMPEYWNPYKHTWQLGYTRFIWMILFAVSISIIRGAKWRQIPIMVLIATTGYQTTFWASIKLASNVHVANAIGAFVIGRTANLYSRMFQTLAAALMLPAIYSQVPGGLAASGSLVAGIQASDEIVGASNMTSLVGNGTFGFVQAQTHPHSMYRGTIFLVGYSMVQIAIGLSVGLFLAALVINPWGLKRKSGLLAF